MTSSVYAPFNFFNPQHYVVIFSDFYFLLIFILGVGVYVKVRYINTYHEGLLLHRPGIKLRTQ